MSSEAEQKQEILDWIEAVVGETIGTSEPFEKVLKDGVVLCKLINKLIPGFVKKINTKGGNFALMENLAAVQKGMRQYGVPEDELFQPVDLFEERNIKAVVKSLAALARICLNKGFEGPAFGPKMAQGNKREFTEEQLRAGRDGHISLQAGYNKGATQSGINIGKLRSVHD
jgi:hypothetical protein